MAFSGEHTYPAPVETVAALFVDPEVVRARYEAAGDRDLEILECGPDGDELLVHTRRTVDVEGLPGFATKVLKPTNTMEQVDCWDAPGADGARDGTFRITVSGAPIKVAGTMRLEPTSDGGTRHTVTGTFEVKVPLIGGKIGSWAEGPAQARLDAEFAFHATRLPR
ncbi:MAG: hypothetical protein AMXMBFR46_08790 [Acidimicrobiia bacterium]